MVVGGDRGTGLVGNVMPGKVRRVGKFCIAGSLPPSRRKGLQEGLKRMETESPQGKVVQRALFSAEITPQ